MNPAYNSALRMLSRRDHVTGELRRKLKQKKYSEAEIQSAIETLDDLGYLKDALVTKRRLEALVDKGFSPGVAIQKLMAIGFDRKHLEAATRLEFNESRENLETIFEKKLGGKNDPKAVARAVRYLMNKGQSFTTVREIFNRIQKPLGLQWPHSTTQSSAKKQRNNEL